jgi:hypothetical protein
MAYVVHRPGGRWEVRESRATPEGPRSRTLATFTTLTPEVIERAAARSSRALAPEALRRLAARAGAPVARPPADEAAARLLAELARGNRPSPAIHRVLAKALGDAEGPGEAEEAVAPWLLATPEERGRALRELLDLTDSFPVRRRPDTLAFPPWGGGPR